MIIGLNAITFVPGRIGGMETYIRNLVDRLQRLDTANSYLLLCDRRFAGEFPIVGDNLRVRHIDYARPSLNWFMRGVFRNTLNVDILKREMRGIEVDIIHHPFTVVTPLGTGIPAVLTFWDMQHEFFPEFFSRLELRKRRRIYPASVREAERVIVSSAYTGDCLAERYDVAAEKIEVIPTGYGPEYRVIDDPEGLQRVRTKYGLDRPFLFYPAATWPHKNHKNLLAALRILKESYGFDGELLLSGIAMQSHGEIMAEVGRLGLSGCVRLLGYLHAGELPWIYNLARMLAFPSLFEGFGIPIVEAMACGCPVVCSNMTSLPEVAGDAGLLFDPRIPEQIAETVWSVWTDEAKRREMQGRGLARARLFTWDETARKTIEVYRKTGSGTV
jgi:glycosyltransferase involved in cell wall biosynthesis